MYKLTFILCLLHSTIAADKLTAVYTSKLPNPSYVQTAIYDGSDSIYIFGGVENGAVVKNVYRYDLNNSTVSVVGELQTYSYGGSLQFDSDGNIFYIGRYNIHKFDVETEQTTLVGTLPYMYMDTASSVKYNDTHVIIIGGSGGCKRTLFFDMEAHIISEASISHCFGDVTTATLNNEAYIFGHREPLVKMNLKTLEFEIMYLPNYPSFPFTSAVTDGVKYIYVGLGFLTVSGEATQGIYQLDTVTLQTKLVHVSNLLVETEYFVHPVASAYVEKENRIYFFGGETKFTSNSTYRILDDIWYLDLTPLDHTIAPPTTEVSITTTPSTETTMYPDIFSCEGRPDGSYPHSSDCAKFIICEKEEMEIFHCDPPLLFDRLLGTCHWPDGVDCELTCVDKPDGPYPHPHDCALFIDCHGGKLDVFSCGERLLFDPVFKQCRLAHLVDCDAE